MGDGSSNRKGRKPDYNGVGNDPSLPFSTASVIIWDRDFLRVDG
jgi:hypothetical protein